MNNDTTAHYDRIAAWSVGRDADDADRIVIVSAVGHLLRPDGAERVPAVQMRLPATADQPAQVVWFDADTATMLGEHLIGAGASAREATQ